MPTTANSHIPVVHTAKISTPHVVQYRRIRCSMQAPLGGPNQVKLDSMIRQRPSLISSILRQEILHRFCIKQDYWSTLSFADGMGIDNNVWLWCCSLSPSRHFRFRNRNGNLCRLPVSSTVKQLFVFIAFANVYIFSEETSLAHRYIRLARLALKIAIAMRFRRRFALSALVCARLCKTI